MLRASIKHDGSKAAISGVTEGAKAGDSGIEHGERLLAFVDAAMQGDAAQLATARDALRAAGGSKLLVDAAAVIGNFERMVRIADGTGIPLDSMVEAISSDLQTELGLDQFVSRRQSASSALPKALSPIIRPIVNAALRVAGWRARRSARWARG